jgi:hypothetical protein
MVLAPLALLTRTARWRVGFLWVLLLASVAIALTVYTPLFAVYRWLPASGLFRVPYRILYLYCFAGSVLSGIGLAATKPGRGNCRSSPKRVERRD